MIDQFTIERIIDTAKIEEVVSDFISLKKRGVNYIGNCPFHNEKTPSFTVSPAKGIYKCFGCGAGGNSINFVMEHEQITYVEALKYLAKKYHIEVIEKEVSLEEQQKKDNRESMMIVSGFAQKYFSEQLFNTTEGKAIGLSYFKERGFREDTINHFQLGYSLDIQDNFTKAAISKGYKQEFLELTGLTIAKNNNYFDRFRGRVMFPIHSISGKVQGFGGRILKIDPEKKTAKYLNSPESEIYNKSRILYGLFFAKKSIVQNDKCYLVEGYTDVISMYQSGIENVVASSGTALSADQIKLIKRFTQNITVLFDGDAAGIKASLRGIDMILQEGLNVKVLLLPNGEDPDSFSQKHSASEFTQYISTHEEDFITFKTKLLLGETSNDPIKKANLITDIVNTISIIPDIIAQSVYIKACSDILNVDERVIYQQVRNNKQKRIHKSDAQLIKNDNIEKSIPQAQKFDLSKDNYCDFQEREILRLLILYGTNELYSIERGHTKQSVSIKDYIFSEITEGEMFFINPLNQKLFSEYFTLVQNSEDVSKSLIHHQNHELCQHTVNIIEEKVILSRYWKKNDNYVETEDKLLKDIVPQTVITYKKKRIELALKETNEALKTVKTDEEAMQLMQKLMNLNKFREILSKDLKRTF